MCDLEQIDHQAPPQLALTKTGRCPPISDERLDICVEQSGTWITALAISQQPAAVKNIAVNFALRAHTYSMLWC
jgi:hypothetical protein